jgi:hypothetical protein
VSDPIFDFLERSGTLSRFHSGRSLYDHLRGTERLLRNWNRAEAICQAGLFHSIYGTNAFRQSSLDIAKRGVLVELIGTQAEHLVYLFHLCDRPWALIGALQSHGIVSRLDGQFLALNEQELVSLIEVECANLLEQRSGKRFFSMLIDALDASPVELGVDVVNAIAPASV